MRQVITNKLLPTRKSCDSHAGLLDSSYNKILKLCRKFAAKRLNYAGNMLLLFKQLNVCCIVLCDLGKNI